MSCCSTKSNVRSNYTTETCIEGCLNGWAGYCKSQCIFREAIDHCRHPTTLRECVLTQINIRDYVGLSFDEIYTKIHNICSHVNQMGGLIKYDITAAICRFYGVNIEKVFITGGGPIRAIRILGIRTKTHKIQIDMSIRLKYVDISELQRAFAQSGHILPDCDNGDELETYICNWQKSM